MIEERAGWFVINVRNAHWYEREAFGKLCLFEDPPESFPDVGVRLYRLEPGKPNCRYHRETAQEDFLVLSGRCLLLVNGEERSLGPWDFVHCPPNVTHVFVGAGNGPCLLLAIGHRPGQIEIFYPENAEARRFNAESPEPTASPDTAYADLPPWRPTEPPPID